MTGRARRHVVVATDEGFAMPTAVALLSLARHARDALQVTVLHESLSQATRDRISRSLPESGVELRWVDAGAFEVGATRGTHLTAATYFRLWVDQAVPDEAQRVLYLDVDTLVRHDIEPLFDTDLDGNAVAAVRSVHFPWVATRGAVNDWEALELAPATPYFNAGVLLIDLDRWRAEDVAGRALEYLRSPHLGGGADQEALNVALAGRWTPLAPMWNQQTPILSNDNGAHLVFTREEIEVARRDPAIVHFQTRPKPWHRGCQHPWRDEWLSTAEHVAFPRVRDLRQRSPLSEARWRLKRAASALVRGR